LHQAALTPHFVSALSQKERGTNHAAHAVVQFQIFDFRFSVLLPSPFATSDNKLFRD
jgi:hypothetical protein